MRILVTGAAGYLGSHTVVALHEAGHDVVGIDNFANSSPIVLERIAELGRPMTFVEGDITDPTDLARAFDPAVVGGAIDAVIHFAGRKSVAESTRDPEGYLHTNLGGTKTVLDAMAAAGVDTLVFSSSCTVYGEGVGGARGIDESVPAAPTNPYGRSKALSEQVIAERCEADPALRAMSLRYFNPIGAHPSGRIGESPLGRPQTLLPMVMGVAAGRFDAVEVYGDDYPTPDGTCVRDFIHVVDLVDGHLRALDALVEGRAPAGHTILNLGTGTGSSVRQLLTMAEQITGRSIPFNRRARRPGDAASVWADPTSAERLLGWRATRDLEAMCADHWRWQRSHPCGYHGDMAFDHPAEPAGDPRAA